MNFIPSKILSTNNDYIEIDIFGSKIIIPKNKLENRSKNYTWY